jgi:hypothetical protein
MKRLIVISLLPLFAMTGSINLHAKNNKESSSVSKKMRTLVTKVAAGCEEQQIDEALKDIIFEEESKTTKTATYRKQLPIHFKIVDMLLSSAKKNNRKLPAILRITHKLIEFYKQMP